MGLWNSRQGVDRYDVGHVIDRRKVERWVAGEHGGDAERPALAGINVELPDEFTRFGEFHDFARVCRIGVNGVAIGGKEIAIGRKHQRQGAAQVPTRKDRGASHHGRYRIPGMWHGKDFVVGCRSHMENVGGPIVGKPRRAKYHRSGVGLNSISHRDSGLAQNGDVGRAYREIDLAFGGIIYIYGLLGTGVTPLPVLEMIAKVATIKAHNMSLTSVDETRRKAAIEFVVKGLQAGALKPVIDRTFTFDEIADVHRYLEQGGQFGKIVVTV
jgi:Zinc-binding dehydrogenase